MASAPSDRLPSKKGWRNILNLVFSVRNLLTIVITPIILLPILLLVEGNEAKCAYCIIVMAVYWITEALPIAVTSLLPIILFPMVGLLSAKDVSNKYLNDTAMLFVGGLIVAAAIEYWNIHKRLALRVLMLVGSEPRWLMFGMMLPTWFLSMWISNTATTAMMIPIANAVLVQLKETKDIENSDAAEDVELTEQNGVTIIRDEKTNTSRKIRENEIESPEYLRMCKALSLGIAYAANCGGVASLTGTNPNVIMKGVADKVFQSRNATSPVTFASWIQFCLPISSLIVAFIWLWLQFIFLRCRRSANSPEQAQRVKAVIRREYKNLGPVSFAQGAVIVHFVILAVLWITRDLGGAGGWGRIFPPKTVTDSTPSILVSISLFLFPAVLPWKFSDRHHGKSVPALLPWKAAEKMVPWGVVLLLGGGFALAHGSQVSGLSDWLGCELRVFKDFEPWVMNLVLCYIVAAATEVTSNTAICSLMMPIMSELAMTLGVNPLYFMFPTAIATSFAFMLPVATPPNAVVFSYGYVKVADMAMAGFIINIVAVLVLVLATETWGDAIFGFHTLPAAFKTLNVTASNSTLKC
ncbi:solute carrier family 13 member 2-like [Crassostrea angulata]|uniref:solute carrier family 13 member 2-like n=1 Tax=Magallana angulata TaxID=2784310 RepID=UPI0022B13689|nr:solute carrier family 13 member 2-like [Crassostrea angulata]